jgi:hypothetical protein
MKYSLSEKKLSLGFFLVVLVVFAQANNVITKQENDQPQNEVNTMLNQRKDFEEIKSQIIKDNMLPDMPDKPPKDILFIQVIYRLNSRKKCLRHINLPI